MYPFGLGISKTLAGSVVGVRLGCRVGIADGAAVCVLGCVESKEVGIEVVGTASEGEAVASVVAVAKMPDAFPEHALSKINNVKKDKIKEDCKDRDRYFITDWLYRRVL